MSKLLDKPFEAVFPLAFDKAGNPTQWLAPSGKPTRRLDKALKCSFRLWPTLPEQSRIEQAVDELAGGVGQSIDLQKGMELTRKLVLEEVEASVWPDGRPDATNDDEAEEQEKLIAAAWRAHSSRHMDALNRMNNLSLRFEVSASWKVLVVDPPEGWEDIAARRMDPRFREHVINGYLSARNKAENDSGNG